MQVQQNREPDVGGYTIICHILVAKTSTSKYTAKFIEEFEALVIP